LIIAGPCLINNTVDAERAVALVFQLVERELCDKFRVKIFGGGTSVEKYKSGIGTEGFKVLSEINKILPCGTEIQTDGQYYNAKGKLSWLWVGARNSQNYGLLATLRDFDGDIMLKRGPGQTIQELIGIYDIMSTLIGKKIYVIERGINTFDRLNDSRWMPDIKGALIIKNEYPSIWDRYIIDCSHSVGRKEYVADIYKAFKEIGCKHFMFECTIDGYSETDQRHMLSVDELAGILK